MNDPSLSNPAYQPLTDQQLSEIDELCDRFDRELVSGRGPRIEAFLADAPKAAQDELLAELLAMEFEYRTAQGDDPEQDDYVQRFPQQESLIAGMFPGVAMAQTPSDDTTQFPGNDTISVPVDVSHDLENFRLIEEIGRGGMGVVWLAEQIQPVKRRVALKLIKSELASKEVIARFDAEKQALALMGHPNIARVLDAGTTNDGRPYFVMELVDGIPITQYCDDNKLSVDQRLQLFVSVCRAVQHAHQKGMIHRDLKPSNVLVTVIDGEATAKVIDFGLAKAVEQNLQRTDETMLTEFGKVVGTVQYMSPEQAELKGPDAEDIDTRTDVYSLGVMLYELLTGSTPLDNETLSGNALLKILQIIREEDPPRPSNRLSSSSIEVNSTVGDRRRLSPARLQHLLQGELDWVVMKALEKDRARRYQTAIGFAQDLTNYLTGKTVAARPPSTWYQIQKFANRNRGLVAALLAIGVVLLAGIAGTSYGLIRANQKTRLAEEKTREAGEEHRKAKASEQLALLERDNAQSNEQRAVKAEILASAEAQRAYDSEADSKFQLANARWDARRARDARDLLREIPSEYRDNFEWHFCNRQFQGSDFTCYGHWEAVRGVAFSPDGTRVATASDDKRIILWDANSGQEIHTLRGHQGRVDEVVFSPDGTRIASKGSDKTIRIWDSRSGQIIATLKGHENDVVGVAFSPNSEQVVSVSMDATVKRWDARSGQEISTLELDFREEVADVAFSPDGKRVVSCGDSVIILWDAATGQKIARRDNDSRWARSVAFSPDGMHIAAAGHDTVTLWDAELTQKLRIANGKAGWIYGLSFSPDGTRIASTGGDRQIRVWDVGSGSEIMALVGHGDDVLGVAFSPDGTRLASAGKDKTLKLWDARTGRKPMSIRAHGNSVCGLAFSNDATRLASVSSDRTFKLWDVQAGKEMVSLNGFYNHNAPGVHCVAFSPNDAYVAFGDADKTVKLLDGQTGAELRSFRGHESWICGVAFSPDSKRLVSGGIDQTVKLWDVETGKPITTLMGHTGRVNSVAFSPDGTRVASACEDLTIKLWDTQSGRELRSLRGHRYNVAGVAFSPDGKQIASSSSDHTVRIWDTQSGEETFRMKGHTAGVMGVVYSPDGKRIASTSFDHTLKLWDTESGQEITNINVDSHALRGVAFSPNGSRIAVGTDNGIIEFLGAPKEHEVNALRGHTDTVIHFSFSDDGSQIYSESKNEKLFWDLATKKRDPDASWDPPPRHTQVSPDGRWLIHGDRDNLLLVDLEYKNTKREKSYRAGKARIDPDWHQEQATAATTAKNWYAATFHFALLMKNDPDQESFYDGLQASFQELKSQFEQEKLDLEPHLAMVVKESLKLSRGSELTNASFEEPRIQKGSFDFRKTIPGWKTTGTMFEIWSTGFKEVKAHDGNQFVELNANEDGTLYQESTGIKRGAVLEFSFAHRGRNGDDTMKLTIIDLGADNSIGGGDDTDLFTKDYTTGNSAWAVYDSTTDREILAQGNKVRFAYSAIYGTGGRGPDKTEGNFLDSAEFGVGVVTANRKAYGVKRLEALLVGGESSERHYLGMRNDRVGIPKATNSDPGSSFVLKVEKKDKFAVLTDREGKYVTARGQTVVLTNTLEKGSRWVIRNPLKADLDPGDGWFSLESASDPGRYMRHFSLFAYAHKSAELASGQAALFLADASWKFVDAQ